MTHPNRYLHYVDMKTAKLFKHGGSQAVRLPKEFRFSETDEEVIIEKQGEDIILRPRRSVATLGDCVREMRERYPATDFPDREQPSGQQERNLELDR